MAIVMIGLLFCLCFLVSANKTIIPVGCVFSDTWEGPSWMASTYYAMQMAVDEINNDTTVLPTYQMELICNSSWYSVEAAAAIGIWNANRGAVAIVGVALSEEATPLSYIAGPTNLPVLSMSATAGSLNNPNYFPSFNRLVPSDTSQIGILISLCTHYNWHNLVVVYTTDDYGRSFYDAFNQVIQTDVAVTFISVPYAYNYNFTPIIPDYQDAGRQILEMDTRIVFLMISTDPVEAIKAFGGVPGLMRSDFVFILNQDSVTDYSGATANKSPADQKKIADLFGGVFSLQVANIMNPKTEQLAMLPYYNYSYPSINQDAYDSVKVLGYALDQLTKMQNLTSTFPSNSDVVAQIRNSSLEGAGGLIRFCLSDRLPLQWTIYNMPIGGLVMNPIFQATTDPNCPDPTSYSHYSLALAGQSPVFATGLTQVPIDRPHPVVVGLMQGTIAACLALVLLGIFIVVLGLILTQVHSTTKVIKGSSVVFCNLIFIGVLIALIALGLETLYDRSKAYACSLVPALLALSFDVTFGSLFAKTWRLAKIFQNAQHLKKKVITNTQVFLPVFVLILFDSFVMSLWLGIDLPRIVVEPDPIRDYTLVQRCGMEQKTAWFSLLIFPKLGVLIYGMQVSYQVRNIDKIFRESNMIAVAIIALFLCGAITSPILVLVWQQIDAATLLLVIGVSLSLISVVLVLFVPKFWRIYNVELDAELGKSTTLDMSATSHSWRPDSRGNTGGSTREELNVLKMSRSGIKDEEPSPTKAETMSANSDGAPREVEVSPETPGPDTGADSSAASVRSGKEEDFYVK